MKNSDIDCDKIFSKEIKQEVPLTKVINHIEEVKQEIPIINQAEKINPNNSNEIELEKELEIISSNVDYQMNSLNTIKNSLLKFKKKFLNKNVNLFFLNFRLQI
jgi:vesicle coat complex subunit